ncbi:hypothetical protein PF008_g29512, partial [Phytophthora fragariae]
YRVAELRQENCLALFVLLRKLLLHLGYVRDILSELNVALKAVDEHSEANEVWLGVDLQLQTLTDAPNESNVSSYVCQ